MNKRLGWLTGLALVIVCGIGWWLTTRRNPIRNVVLISIDTCRADHLGCYGKRNAATPNIDQLAAEGTLFEHATSPVPLTLPAHCSLLTGTYPPYHGVHDNTNGLLNPLNQTLAETLKEQGYTTAAFVSSFVLAESFGLDQGFDRYDCDCDPAERIERPGNETTQRAKAFLAARDGKPFFTFLHYYDPHKEYDPPEPFASRFADDPYSGEIAFVDQCIGEIIDQLETSRLMDSTLIVLVADHGESLGEHGESEHGYFVYHSTTHIPMIIKRPGNRAAGRIGTKASLVDIVPTILAQLGIQNPAATHGMDLFTSEDTKTNRSVYVESVVPTIFACNPILGLKTERETYLHTTTPEYYDVAEDPHEAHNVIADHPDRVAELHDDLLIQLEDWTRQESSSGDTLDESTREVLESLGYVGGGAVDDLQIDPDKANPSDWIAYYERHQEVIALGHAGQLEQASAQCRTMLETWPEMPNTHFLLAKLSFDRRAWSETIQHGEAYLNALEHRSDPGKSLLLEIARAHHLIARSAFQLENCELARQHWRRALQIRPEWPQALSPLGDCLYLDGDLEGAVEHWGAAASLQPGQADLHHKIAAAYYKLDQWDQAETHWRHALEIDPDHEAAQANLDNLQSRLKAKHEIERLSRMVEQSPGDIEARNRLASAYLESGDVSAAIKQFRINVEQDPDGVQAVHGLAWALAANPQSQAQRREALQLARRACELTQYAHAKPLDTLALAYAINGDLANALLTAEKALTVVENAQLEQGIRQRIEIYRRGLDDTQRD